MRAPINVSLRGFLDFFGLKSGGRNPQELAAFIQPTMDLARWYMESRVLNIEWVELLAADTPMGAVNITATAPTNLSNGIGVIVPNSELWVLLPGTTIQAGFAQASGQVIHLGLMHASGVSQNQIPLGAQAGFDGSSATIFCGQSRTLEQPYWLAGGDSFQAWTWGAAVPAASQIVLSGTLRLVRLLV